MRSTLRAVPAMVRVSLFPISVADQSRDRGGPQHPSPGHPLWDRVLFFTLNLLVVAIFPVTRLCAVPLVYSSALAHRGRIRAVRGFDGRNRLGAQGQQVRRAAGPDPGGAGQTVIDTGPYAVVRHPFYVLAVLLFGGIPLCLGSLWALLPAALAIGLLVLRTALEDRMLGELDGYQDYARRVRYRLVPGIW